MSRKYTGRRIYVAKGEQGGKKIVLVVLVVVLVSKTSRKEGKRDFK